MGSSVEQRRYYSRYNQHTYRFERSIGHGPNYDIFDTSTVGGEYNLLLRVCTGPIHQRIFSLWICRLSLYAVDIHSFQPVCIYSIGGWSTNTTVFYLRQSGIYLY